MATWNKYVELRLNRVNLSTYRKSLTDAGSSVSTAIADVAVLLAEVIPGCCHESDWSRMLLFADWAQEKWSSTLPATTIYKIRADVGLSPSHLVELTCGNQPPPSVFRSSLKRPWISDAVIMSFPWFSHVQQSTGPITMPRTINRHFKIRSAQLRPYLGLSRLTLLAGRQRFISSRGWLLTFSTCQWV